MQETIRTLEMPSNSQFLTLFANVSEKIRQIYNDIDQGVVYKTDNSPQTKADRVSNDIITAFLKKNTPFQILSEESETDGSFNENEFWIVDPLDGSRDFLGKTGEFSIMIAFIKNKRPIWGAVYHPILNICYMAKKGEGAFLLNGKDGSSIRLHASNETDISKMRMVVSRFHKQGTDLEVARKLGVKELMPHGSFGLKVGLIAEGKAEIFLNSSNKTSIWDSAPNIVILSEAGGRITDLNGNDLLVDPKKRNNKNGILATNGRSHQKILRQVRKALSI